MKLTVTKTEFKSWLEEKKPSASVGRGGDDEGCPLAIYFRTINEVGKGKILINADAIQGPLSSKATQLKPWMNEFISKVDNWIDDEENKTGSDRISAKKALDILASC